ncbi:MAG: hypothetical protein Q8R91_03790 [Candidatus Omnitrophota bacterium]|nr:hypothetical protein [Candidatus Omnitrophota bacterium]
MRFPVVLLLLLVIGCAPPANREQLAKEVVAVDPEFELVLDKHRELSNRIETYQRELALKRSAVERNIAQMRQDLAETVAKIRAKTVDVKQRMEPDRQRLELALSMASEELRARRGARSSLGRAMAQLRKAAKGRQAPWTPEERAEQEARLHEMVQDAGRIDEEIATLKAHVRLLKIKFLLIRL